MNNTKAAEQDTRQRSGDADGQVAPKKGGPRRIILFGVLALLLGTGLYFGITYLVFASHHRSTDDAQTEGHVYPILPRVSGQVVKVLVDDNTLIKAGQVLVVVDSTDYVLRRNTSAAALANAQAMLYVTNADIATAQANIGVAQAQISAAQATHDRQQRDLERSRNLRKEDVISQQELDAQEANAITARSQYDATRNQFYVVQSQYVSRAKQANVSQSQIAQRKADLDNANLLVSYCTIKAPVSGIVSKKNVEVGQYVSIAQQLMAITGTDEAPWVIANFKETQLDKIRVGQDAEIKVDAYGGHVFHGKVQSISPATGARFALLPPDNATGNFVKVVQRIPVKIVITDPPDADHPLRVGMNVEAIITTN